LGGTLSKLQSLIVQSKYNCCCRSEISKLQPLMENWAAVQVQNYSF
jgi:hypothetical protein